MKRYFPDFFKQKDDLYFVDPLEEDLAENKQDQEENKQTQEETKKTLEEEKKTLDELQKKLGTVGNWS